MPLCSPDSRGQAVLIAAARGLPEAISLCKDLTAALFSRDILPATASRCRHNTWAASLHIESHAFLMTARRITSMPKESADCLFLFFLRFLPTA
jgi:hypothetical protein